MSANAFTRTLHFRLRPSNWLRRVTIIGHLAAAVIVLWVGAEWPLLYLLILPLACSAWLNRTRCLPGWMPADGRFQWAPDDRILWRASPQQTSSAQCLDVERIGTMAIRLRLRELPSGRRRNMLILHDSVAAEDHRRLRARATVRGRGSRPDDE